jgi:hypothetical protein
MEVSMKRLAIGFQLFWNQRWNVLAGGVLAGVVVLIVKLLTPLP